MIGSILKGAGAVTKIAGGIMGMIDAKKQRKLQRSQMDMQREFAQHGIRWKVDDARAAGLHPLAALGAQTSSYYPVRVGETSPESSLDTMGQGLAGLGSLGDKSLAKEAAEIEVDLLRLRRFKEWLSIFGSTASPENVSDFDKHYNFGDGFLREGGNSPVDLVPSKIVRSDPKAGGGVQAGVVSYEQLGAQKSVKWGTVYRLELAKEMAELMEENLGFKLGYYTTKLSNYWEGWKAAFGGPKSVAGKRWIEFWNKVLPKPFPGKKWHYLTASGAFTQVPLDFHETPRRTPQDWADLPH